MRIKETKNGTAIRRTSLVFICSIFIHFQCGLSLSNKENSQDKVLQDLFGLYLLNSLNCTNGLWARNVSTNRPECIPATKVITSQFANIYIENSLNLKLDLNLLASDFDTKIHPALTSTFGQPSDMNGDGRIDIFILDIRDGARPNGPFVAGFFDPSDLATGVSSSNNRREILYMDGKELIALLTRDPSAFESTVAHEYQHLIRYPRIQASGGSDDIWINEGTSEVASDIGGFFPQTSRIRCFQGSIDSPCGGGGNGVSLLEWSSNPTNDSSYILKQYSYAYVFTRYLYDTAGASSESKRLFFFNSVNGNSSRIRGNTILNLMQLYRESNSMDANLGSSNAEAFLRMLNSFWLQMIPGSTSNPIVRSGSPSTNLDLATLVANYPLSSTLTSANSSVFPILSDIPNRVAASAGVRVANSIDVNSTVQAISASNKITSITNPSSRTLLFAEANANISLQRGLESSESPPENTFVGSGKLGGKWNTWSKDFEKDHESGFSKGSEPLPKPLPVCGHPFLME